MAAFGAAETAQICINMVIVSVFASAFGAFSGIGKIDIALGADCLVEAVPDNFIGDIDGEGGGERIFRIEHQDGFGAAFDTVRHLCGFP